MRDAFHKFMNDTMAKLKEQHPDLSGREVLAKARDMLGTQLSTTAVGINKQIDHQNNPKSSNFFSLRWKVSETRANCIRNMTPTQRSRRRLKWGPKDPGFVGSVRTPSSKTAWFWLVDLSKAD